MRAVHIATAALTLVPPAHWNIETHRSNISSYDGSQSVSYKTDIDRSSVSRTKTFQKELYHYLRWALSASAPGPGIPETMTILGREETLRRLQDAKTLTQSLAFESSRPVPKSAGNSEKGDRTWMGSLSQQ